MYAPDAIGNSAASTVKARDSTPRFFSGRGANPAVQRSGRAAREGRQREDDEADTGEEEGNPDDEAEERERRRHVAHVECGREARLADPDVSGGVGDRLVRLWVGHRLLPVSPPFRGG